MGKYTLFTIQLRMLPPKLRIRVGDQTPAEMVRMSHHHGAICSYPKSGNTWLSFLLANLMRPGETIRGTDVRNLVPDVHGLKAHDIDGDKAPAIFKSHEPFRPDYDRVVYLYRDPRDVMLSYYHYSKGLGTIGPDVTVDDYITGFTSPDPSLNPPFGNWGEHVGSWFGACEDEPTFLPVSYEAMLEAPEAELARVASFLDIDHDPDRIESAVHQSTAEEMRKLEKAGELHRQGHSREFDNLTFIRKAKAGSWREELSPGAAHRIEEAFGPMMERLGYL